MAAGAIFITGGKGFIGTLLTNLLTKDGHEVAAYEGELMDGARLADSIRAAQPAHVVHLAGISSPPACEADPGLAFSVNAAGTGLLADLLARHAPQAHLVFASTGQIYRKPGKSDPGPIDESWPVHPQNVYAQTKRDAELLLLGRGTELRSTILRIFNHSHKSQGDQFFLPYLYQEILRRRGSHALGPIGIGNLDIQRDIGTVQDLLGAFRAVISQPGARGSRVFNVCAGVPRHLGALSDLLKRHLGVEAEIVTDPRRVRPDEPKSIQGSHDALTRETGWRPSAIDDASFIEAFLADLSGT